MPNIKSAIKRVSVIEKKTLRNNMIKSGYRTAIKKFEAAVEAGDKANAEQRSNKENRSSLHKGCYCKKYSSKKKI